MVGTVGIRTPDASTRSILELLSFSYKSTSLSTESVNITRKRLRVVIEFEVPTS